MGDAASAIGSPSPVVAPTDPSIADIRSQWLTVDNDDAGLGTMRSPADAGQSVDDGALHHTEVLESPVPPLKSFAYLQLPPALQTALHAQGVVTPTPIQRAVVPVALKGADLVGVAATGSGKTLAYLLPSVLRLLSAGSPREPFALVACPTRELALQITACAEGLLAAAAVSGSHLTAAAVWGGGSRREQKRRLEGGASVIVATPGRLLDFVCEQEEEGRGVLGTVRVLVLDEGDRMLEEGLRDQIDALACRTALIRQTLFFSATWPEEASALACRLCRVAPVLLRVGTPGMANAVVTNGNILQRVEVFDLDNEEEEAREARKRTRLLQLLEMALAPAAGIVGSCGPPSGMVLPSQELKCIAVAKAIVFCMTKKFADSLVEHLRWAGWHAVAVHGDKSQEERLRNLNYFASGASQVLVATDVLGRGLDLPRVTHVFVYDFPSSIEEYVHRIGRTARGLHIRGEAVSFFEFVHCLPGLAAELVVHLEASAQPVPQELRRVAAEVASGARAWPVKAAKGAAKQAQATDDEQLPLARPEELGSGWHANGQRSWLLCEGGDEATGWLVFCSGGMLQTHRGPGAWRLVDSGRLVVELGGASQGPQHYELQLHRWWEGRRREHFTSTGTEASDVPGLTGWVSRSKVYRYSGAAEQM